MAGRARLKKWHQPAASALSAHLFSGAICMQLWCTPREECLVGAGKRLVHLA
jgi:hypothetical protein